MCNIYLLNVLRNTFFLIYYLKQIKIKKRRILKHEKNEILELKNEIVSFEMLDAIWESPEIATVDNCGNSGINPDWTWWDVQFVDGDDMAIYTHSYAH